MAPKGGPRGILGVKMGPRGPKQAPKRPQKVAKMDQDEVQRLEMSQVENIKKPWVVVGFSRFWAPSWGHVGVKIAHWRCK